MSWQGGVTTFPSFPSYGCKKDCFVSELVPSVQLQVQHVSFSPNVFWTAELRPGTLQHKLHTECRVCPEGPAAGTSACTTHSVRMINTVRTDAESASLSKV
ncbi:hypothetical protein Bbelb_225600 [Branchiostoma belcheri]|nr:hypothetical protein Bbelb_225600 [Branchiostoma belcheri]